MARAELGLGTAKPRSAVRKQPESSGWKEAAAWCEGGIDACDAERGRKSLVGLLTEG